MLQTNEVKDAPYSSTLSSSEEKLPFALFAARARPSTFPLWVKTGMQSTLRVLWMPVCSSICKSERSKTTS